MNKHDKSIIIGKQIISKVHGKMGNSFDENEAIERMGGRREVFIKMSGYFVSYVPKLLEPLEEAMKQKDWPAVHQAAHKIAGSVGNFGKNSAYYAALNLQETIDRNNLEDIFSDYEKLIKEVEELKRGLQVLYEKESPTLA